ncbi:MAG: pentose kinase [Phycisphaerales bacterium]|nr:pentose kinase [Phycisphaerales bacterium]MBT7170220.1 pentose kinase [Phycisphaerales bacterium]
MMMDHVIAYDFGTGGIKASLYTPAGECVASHFATYETSYPNTGWHEQRPEDWWVATVDATRSLLAETDVDPAGIGAIGISGHSLALVPLGAEGELLRDQAMIWSDSRPDTQPADFFQHISEEEWYRITGNGFPPSLYTAFKIMWLRDNEPDVYAKIDKVLGSKDYINFRMTGAVATDYSYASGCGVWDLHNWCYSETLLTASGLDRSIFPDAVASSEVVGKLTADAAGELGLAAGVKVVAGGVDNSCMALGARAFREGDVYNSMGSSSWIAVTSETPLLDDSSRPYVFAHVVPDKFTSAIGVFSTGSSLRWIREPLGTNLDAPAEAAGKRVFELILDMAYASEIGAKGALFLPTMAGGSSLDPSQNVRGAFVGLDLGQGQGDLFRAVIEGISMSQALAVRALGSLTALSGEMLAVGGGNRGDAWMQIYADLYDKAMVRTNIGQQAAALGAAAVALVGVGLWDDYSPIADIHKVQSVIRPNHETQGEYQTLLAKFKRLNEHLCQFAEEG